MIGNTINHLIRLAVKKPAIVERLCSVPDHTVAGFLIVNFN